MIALVVVSCLLVVVGLIAAIRSRGLRADTAAGNTPLPHRRRPFLDPWNLSDPSLAGTRVLTIGITMMVVGLLALLLALLNLHP